MSGYRLSTAFLFGLSGVFGIALTGCSGSSSSSDAPSFIPPPATRASFAELAELGQQLLDETWTEDLTPEANMPVAGRATYSGAASFRGTDSIPEGLTDEEYVQLLVNEPELMSEVDLTADFGAAAISGKLSNFQEIVLGPLDGELNISNGTIFGNSFDGDLSGAIGPTGDVRNTTGGLGGVFLGNAADYAVGGAYLDVGEGETYLPFDGVFSTKK